MSIKRTWGRNGLGEWAQVDTKPNGDETDYYLTTLCQTLKLHTGECPLHRNAGIAHQQAAKQTIPPDFYVKLIEQQFQPYFMSLSIIRVNDNFDGGKQTYTVNVTSKTGQPSAAQVVF